MVKYESLYNSFLDRIARKIPQKTRVVSVLADLLCITKEAVYRRLRGDIPFTFYEVMTISRQLDIPLDTLDMDDSSLSKPFKLKLIEYINPAESDFALMEEMVEVMKSFADIPDPEAAEITNILPQPLYVNYVNVFRFYLFKWHYQSNRFKKTIPYRDIVIADKLQRNQEEYVKWAKCLHADYIFDKQLFHYLVTNIRYFFHVDLITKEDIKLIQDDLFKILDEINYLSCSGSFRETGKRVNIYISDVNVDTNYIYVATSDYQLTIVKAFLLNGIASTDRKTFEEVRCWVQSMKQQSVMITKSNEKERINYLKEQHNLIEGLSAL